MECPTACDALHKDVGTAQEGDICPNNPLHRFKYIYDNLSKYAIVYENFEYLERLLQIGALPSINELTPAEAEASLVLKKYLDSMQSAQIQTAAMAPVGALAQSLSSTKSPRRRR